MIILKKKICLLVLLLLFWSPGPDGALAGTRYFDAYGNEITKKEYNKIAPKYRNRYEKTAAPVKKATFGNKNSKGLHFLDFDCSSNPPDLTGFHHKMIGSSGGSNSGRSLYNMEGRRRTHDGTFGAEEHKAELKKGRYSFKTSEVNIDKPYLEVHFVRNVVSESKEHVASRVPVQYVPIYICFRFGEKKWAGRLLTDEHGAIYIEMIILADLAVYSAQSSGSALITLSTPDSYSSSKTIQVSREKLIEIYKKWNLDNFRFEVTRPTFDKPYLTAKLVLTTVFDTIKEIGLDPTKNVPITIQYLEAGKERKVFLKTDNFGRVQMDLRNLAKLTAEESGSPEFTSIIFLAPKLYACRKTIKISKKKFVGIYEKWWVPDTCYFDDVHAGRTSKYLTVKLSKKIFSKTAGKKIALPAAGTAVSISYLLNGKKKTFTERADNNGLIRVDLRALAEEVVFDSQKSKYKKIRFYGPPEYSCSNTSTVPRKRLEAIYVKWSTDTFSFKITPPSVGSPKVTALLVRKVQQAAEGDKKILPVSNIPITIKYADAGREEVDWKKTDDKGEIAIDLCDIGRSFLYDVKAPEYVEYRISSPRPFFCKQSIRIIRDDLLNFYKKWDADGNMCPRRGV